MLLARRPPLALLLVALSSLSAGLLPACKSRDASEGEARLRAYLERLRGDGGVSGRELARSLVPTDQDLPHIFAPELVPAATELFGGQRRKRVAGLPPIDAATELLVRSATAAELAEGGRIAKEFPRGLTSIAPRLRPELRLYRVTLVNPEQKPRRIDSFAFVNGRWVLLSKIWRMTGSQLRAARPARAADAPAPAADTAAPAPAAGPAPAADAGPAADGPAGARP